MSFKDAKLKHIILIVLTLIIFFVVTELSVILYLLLFLPKALRLISDQSLLKSAIRSVDSGGCLKSFEHRFRTKKVHLKYINVNEDNYFGDNTNFSGYHWEIGSKDLKGFSEDYFSVDNLAYLRKKNFIYVDQKPWVHCNWQFCHSNISLTSSTLLLLSNIMLSSYKSAACILAISCSSWLLIASVLCLGFGAKYLVLLLQIAAKVFILTSSISGVYNQEDNCSTPPTWPASTYFTHRYSECYEYEPLLLVEYENYPHWLVHYLLLPKDLKYLEDCKFLNEDSSSSTWQGYILFNSLAAVRSYIDRRFFTCPYGNTYKFLIKRDYLNSALLYLNFSLVPLISLRIRIKSMICFKVFLWGKPLKWNRRSEYNESGTGEASITRVEQAKRV